MAFQVSRFVFVNGRKVPASDIGSPYPSREQAEEKLLEIQKSLGLVGHRFEIREIEETPRMRESWVRQRLLPAVVFKKAEDIKGKVIAPVPVLLKEVLREQGFWRRLFGRVK